MPMGKWGVRVLVQVCVHKCHVTLYWGVRSQYEVQWGNFQNLGLGVFEESTPVRAGMVLSGSGERMT